MPHNIESIGFANGKPLLMKIILGDITQEKKH
jgi:hypothetical protein